MAKYRRHAESLINLIKENLQARSYTETLWGVEVGVWRGHTSVALLTELPGLILYAVDPWENGDDNPTMPKSKQELLDAHNEFLELTKPFKGRVVPNAMTSQKASKGFESGFMDFVFIDGVHTYEQVRQDIELWYPKVQKGGLLCGHDYNGVGDRKGRFGVKKAVDEWASLYGYVVNEARGSIWWVTI